MALGLYQLPADGAGYTVTAELTSTPGRFRPAPTAAPPGPLSARPPRRELPARPGHRWLAGDLHAHTVHSDGALTVPELARLGAEQGLDFLAVTDHNTVSHHAELGWASARYGVTLIPGQEVTTDSGHAGALGDLGWVDFREPADSWLAATERGGGLLSVNHPIGGHVSWLKPMRRKPPLVEVWHWSWLDPRWTNTMAWWLAWDPAAVPVGGSDWHRPGSDAVPGTPTTWVECAADGADPAGGSGAGSGRSRTASPGCWPACGTDDAPSLPGGTARCCSGWTASSPRSAGTAPSWPARTARAPWCAATWPGSPPPPAATGCSTRPRHPGPHRLAARPLLVRPGRRAGRCWPGGPYRQHHGSH